MNKYLITIPLLISTTAFGRMSDRRDGVYFGTDARMLSEQYDTSSPEGTTSHSTTTEGIRPYIGYAFGGVLGLGLAFTAEQTTLTESSKPSDKATAQTQIDETLKGVSPFVKLLFAKVMYLQAGLGVYSARITRTDSSQSGTGADFHGSSLSSSSNGTGYGFDFSGGIEISMGAGFYFTSGLFWRQVSMTDYTSGNTQNNLNNVKSELQFGIANYLSN